MFDTKIILIFLKNYYSYVPWQNLFYFFSLTFRLKTDNYRTHVRFMYVNHCNSCLLIISASISHSKPLANADRTLSLSRSPHFAPLYCSTSAKTLSSFSSTPSDSSICAWYVQEPPTVTPAELVSDRAYALQSYTGNAWAVDTVNNLITIHRPNAS